MCGFNQEIVNIINELRDASKVMNSTIKSFLDQMDIMEEDIEDLAMNKAQETEGLSVLSEMRDRMKKCKTDMNLVSGLAMNSDMGVTGQAIKNLETNSLEMFTRLARLESLHIIPGLESTMQAQLKNWGTWQASAAKLKKIFEEHM